MCLSLLRSLFCAKGGEQPSPGNWVPWSKIVIQDGNLTAILPVGVKYWLCGVGESGSMDPVMDAGTMCLMFEVKDGTPVSADDLIVGDIAVYRKPTEVNNFLIRHRIIGKGEDELGRYFTFRGDNNNSPDKFRIRDDMVRWVVAAMFYGKEET
uniref:Peptidase n=1 Tax=viral metagenome TaxID=1070528 RepID=A0A6M3IIT1_9ZZZZ